VQEHGAAGRDGQFVDGQAIGRGARPGEAHVVEFEHAAWACGQRVSGRSCAGASRRARPQGSGWTPGTAARQQAPGIGGTFDSMADCRRHGPAERRRLPIISAMPATLQGRLVVAISSRALFDFEEENRVFEAGDDRAYMQLQLQRLEQPAAPAWRFRWCNKLLAFNDGTRRGWRW
jgi:hypothetical protein